MLLVDDLLNTLILRDEQIDVIVDKDVAVDFGFDHSALLLHFVENLESIAVLGLTC